MKVYILQEYSFGEFGETILILGAYDSREKAQKKIKEVLKQLTSDPQFFMHDFMIQPEITVYDSRMIEEDKIYLNQDDSADTYAISIIEQELE